GIYGLVHFKNTAVGIIPLDENYNTWIVGQYRYTLSQYSWEIPEGGGKIGIDTLESAKRELLEETGIKAKHWEEILRLDLSNSVTDEQGIVYVAKGLSFHEPQPDDDELLEIKKLPFSDLFEMAMRGEISDGLALAAIFKAQWLIQKGLI
ncbi:MAG TPA: DNA mismatch repair protein MutT, partial [Flavobacteriales bacterium]|nr:DNA mismatch repair protein MutT [Flavobacteriales bacterium]